MRKEVPLEFPEELGVQLHMRIAIGEHVRLGQVIAEAETEKATLQMQADESFTLRAIRKTPRGVVLIVDED